MTRLVIFDLDGTLVDSCAVCIAILSQMLEERGSDRRIDPVGARSYMSVGGTRMVSALLGPDCGDPDEELADFRNRYSCWTTPADSLYPGVDAGLADLRRAGLELAVCSNKPQNLCEKVLEDTGLAVHFSAVVGGNPQLRAKPAPDLLETVLAACSANAEECLFVGDSEVDHATATKLEIPFLFMTYGYAEAGWSPKGCDGFDCFATMTGTILDRLWPSRREVRLRA